MDDLDYSLPDGTPDPELKFVPLAFFSNLAEAEMARELLINNGIRALLSGAHFGGLEPLRIPGGFSEIQLLVAEPDEPRAREFYEAFFTEVSSAQLEAEDEGEEA
jgi:hypothetical protein